MLNLLLDFPRARANTADLGAGPALDPPTHGNCQMLGAVFDRDFEIRVENCPKHLLISLGLGSERRACQARPGHPPPPAVLCCVLEGGQARQRSHSRKHHPHTTFKLNQGSVLGSAWNHQTSNGLRQQSQA